MRLTEIIKAPATKIVDVRSEQEFAMGHINNAINIPLSDLPGSVEKIKDLNATNLVFYCMSGNRSSQAVSFLKQMGLENVYNGGGIEDLKYLLN